MEDEKRDTDESLHQLHEQPCPLPKKLHCVALLNHFNCFAVSETSSKGKNSAAAADASEDSCGKKTKGGWKTMPYIIGNESCEKLAVVGLRSNMIVYLKTKYNMQQVTATNVINIWAGTSSFSTLVGAFVADSYLGRYRTIVIGCLSYILGISLLALTALVKQFLPSPCTTQQKKLGKCETASKEQWTILVLVFIFACVGSSCIRPCSLAFGGDQFEQEGSQGKKRLQSFFNWYYFSSTAAVIAALTIIVYVQSAVSWSLGFGICALLMLISTLFFVSGASLFRRDIPEGSPFPRFAQVIVAAIRKRNLSLPSHPALFYHGQSSPKMPLTERFRFFNKAAIITDGDVLADGSVGNRWRLSSIQQIEGLKIIIATLPIFSCGIANAITKGQQHTFAVLQALTMNRRVGSSSFKVPAASFSVFSLLALITCLAFYDRVVVPLARRMTKGGRGITVLQRIGTGFVISILSMVVAGFVEVKRRNVARTHGLADDPTAVVPISAFWLLPQFCISGVAEAFSMVGHLEFFYTQFPSTMRSTAIAVSSCTIAVADYLSTIFITLIHNTTGGNGKPDWLDDNLNRGRLENFYWLLASMEAVNLLYFIVCASWYKYRVSEPMVEEDGAKVKEMECIDAQP